MALTKKSHVLWQSLLIFVSIIYFSSTYSMERRRAQYATENAYYIIPIPYSLEGVGEGIAFAGVLNNTNESNTDLTGYIFTGDVEGYGGIIQDLHLIPERLIFDFTYEQISKASIRNYNARGMSSRADDYTVLELKEVEYYGTRLTTTFLERMINIYGIGLNAETQLASVRDQTGAIIQTASSSSRESSMTYAIGVLLDWTDDYTDPRKGFRFDLSRWMYTQDDPLMSEHYQIESNITAYIPIGKQSTWAFNFLRADSHISRQGETNFSRIEQHMGFDCNAPSLTVIQQDQCINVVNSTIAKNRHGYVTDLGGWSRLRAYPDGRYQGAHSQFYGTEIRWNITEEFTPFDIFVARDIRTTIQLAFFYERGSIEDEKDKVGNIWRESYGIGTRLITASGLVFRADYATGDEGNALSVIVSYPWEGL